MIALILAAIITWFGGVAHAKSGSLSATALVPCMDSTGITASRFNFTYDRATSNIIYDVSVNVAISGYVYADLDLYVYGLKALTTRLNPCTSSSLKQLCPVNAGKIEIRGQDTLSADVVKHIPGIAFTVPNIDAFLVAKVRDDTTGDLVGCVLFEVANTKTVEETAVKWVSACIAGLGLLVSGALTYFGSSVTAQHISATTMLMFNYFQSMVMVDMEAVERVPPMASAWTEDVAWSVGLVYTTFLEKIFRWYVQSTGGNPATYKLYASKAVLAQKKIKRSLEAVSSLEAMEAVESFETVQNAASNGLLHGLDRAIPPRVADYLKSNGLDYFSSDVNTKSLADAGNSLTNLVKRATNAVAKETYANTNSQLEVYRGIKRVAWKMGIEETSAVLTTYTIFVFICVCVVVIFMALQSILFFVARGNSRHKSSAQYYHSRVPFILKGTILKLIYVAFPSIMVFSMWEWIQRDSAGVIVTSVVIFVLTLAVIIFNLIKVFLIAKESVRETGTPAYLLFGDAKTLTKYGFIYSQFTSRYFYFSAIYLAYNFAKACFIAFAQTSGQTQALALFIIEIAMLVLVCYFKPFLSRAANIINIVMQVIVTLNAMFFLFFSNLMTQPLIVNGVMGVIFFVLNAAFSVVLLLYTIIFSIVCILQRNRDSINKNHRVNDDRMSFIEDQKPIQPDNVAGELAALGQAARADHDPGASTEDGHNWFDDSGHNSYEVHQMPRSSLLSDGTPRSMASSTSLNVPAVNDLNTHFGHKITNSQTQFGLISEHTLPESDEKSSYKKKKYWFGKK